MRLTKADQSGQRTEAGLWLDNEVDGRVSELVQQRDRLLSACKLLVAAHVYGGDDRALSDAITGIERAVLEVTGVDDFDDLFME